MNPPGRLRAPQGACLIAAGMGVSSALPPDKMRAGRTDCCLHKAGHADLPMQQYTQADNIKTITLIRIQLE